MGGAAWRAGTGRVQKRASARPQAHVRSPPASGRRVVRGPPGSSRSQEWAHHNALLPGRVEQPDRGGGEGLRDRVSQKSRNHMATSSLLRCKFLRIWRARRIRTPDLMVRRPPSDLSRLQVAESINEVRGTFVALSPTEHYKAGPSHARVPQSHGYSAAENMNALSLRAFEELITSPSACKG